MSTPLHGAEYQPIIREFLTKPQQVRAIVSALPVATSPRQAKKAVRGAFREGYGPDWWRSDRTKGVYNRVLEAYVARNK